MDAHELTEWLVFDRIEREDEEAYLADMEAKRQLEANS